MGRPRSGLLNRPDEITAVWKKVGAGQKKMNR